MVNSTLIYLERDGQYLMLHRTKKKNDMNHDKWLGIGGKFEEGESPEDCVIRETLEETGLQVRSLRFRGLVTFVLNDDVTEYMHLFTSDDFDGEVKDCDEGELAWVKKEEVPCLPVWEGDKLFLKELTEDRGFFSLKLVYRDDVLKDSRMILY
ncbi:MAG: 8-oxo-dGTP diphosphatase [Lachnospiraceae bacterium]|nr:8-oxo-dGTP diphosphatase [Lachnospiraceae bacterium]